MPTSSTVMPATKLPATPGRHLSKFEKMAANGKFGGRPSASLATPLPVLFLAFSTFYAVPIPIRLNNNNK